jgi:hypothetical protein
MPLVAIAITLAALATAIIAISRPGAGRSVWARFRRAVAGDIRGALFARRAWLGIGLVSALVVAGHAFTFVLAARTAGTSAPIAQLAPIALLVMGAMALPSIAGWGPREGITAWAFGAAGLGAQRGVATAVVYGIMVLVACLPGAAVLLVAWFRPTRPPRHAESPLPKRTFHA